MNDILLDIFYGNVMPCEDPMPSKIRLVQEQALNLFEEHRDSIQPEQRDKPDAFMQKQSELNCMEMEHSFCSGVRFGAQLMLSIIPNEKD